MFVHLMKPIQVVIVEGYPLLRVGLLSWFRRAPAITVIGIASDGETGLDLVTECQPQVLLLDLRLPDMPGVDVVTHAHAQSPGTAIVVLTGNDVDISLSTFRRMGIRALVRVSESSSRVVEIIQAVAAGENLLARTHSPDDAERITAVELTKREHEILQLIAAGERNADIARELALSVRTVEFHVSSLLRKLEAQSRTQATDIARKLGMLSDDN